MPQRREFFSVFDSIYKISGAGCRFNVNLDLDNFFLEKGEGLRRDYFQALPESYRPIEGGDLGLKQWLHLVCNEKLRPIFLFPEQVAGPDVMFVYRERGEKTANYFRHPGTHNILGHLDHESNILQIAQDKTNQSR